MGPFEDVGIRADSPWNVPEPELAFTLYKGEIVGYTIGNDMSSRAIEGEKPALPRAGEALRPVVRHRTMLYPRG